MKKLYYNLFLFILISCVNNIFSENPKIYDCFTFYNELEILEIRLNELYDYVDHFVLVEAKQTHRGNPKPLYYQENRHLFKKFEDKIIHIIIEEPLSTDTSKLSNNEFGPNWARENYQREQIMRGLNNCSSNDLILISDVDEIIRPSSIVELLKNTDTNEFRLIACQQKMYKCFINRYCDNESPWYGTIGILYKHLKNCSPQYCRNERTRSKYIIKDAGWHFSFIGGYSKIVNKLESFAHSESDNPQNKDITTIERKILEFSKVEVDDSYPKYIRDNLNKYKKMGFIDISNDCKALHFLPN